jgi:hypothetical protein
MHDLHAVADYSDVFIFSLLIWIPRLSIADWSCYLVVTPPRSAQMISRITSRSWLQISQRLLGKAVSPTDNPHRQP